MPPIQPIHGRSTIAIHGDARLIFDKSPLKPNYQLRTFLPQTSSNELSTQPWLLLSACPKIAIEPWGSEIKACIGMDADGRAPMDGFTASFFSLPHGSKKQNFWATTKPKAKA